MNKNIINKELSKFNDELNDKFADLAVYNIKDEITAQGLVKTGKLRDSIDIKVQNAGPLNNKHTIYMKYYGEYLELGTPNIPPHRFTRKALNKTAKEIEKKIKKNGHSK